MPVKMYHAVTVGLPLNSSITIFVSSKILLPVIVAISDLKQETINFFRKMGFKSQRMSENDLTDKVELLLENLKLIENGQLKRSAILLFHSDPERYVTGAYIKIGYFESDTDLRYQDEIHGNLFEQIENTRSASIGISSLYGTRGVFLMIGQ